MTPSEPPTRTPLRLSVVRDVTIVLTLVVLGLYAGASFLIPLTMALLINVLIIALSDRVIALTRAPVWLANLAAVSHFKIPRQKNDQVRQPSQNSSRSSGIPASAWSLGKSRIS